MAHYLIWTLIVGFVAMIVYGERLAAWIRTLKRP